MEGALLGLLQQLLMRIVLASHHRRAPIPHALALNYLVKPSSIGQEVQRSASINSQISSVQPKPLLHVLSLLAGNLTRYVFIGAQDEKFNSPPALLSYPRLPQDDQGLWPQPQI